MRLSVTKKERARINHLQEVTGHGRKPLIMFLVDKYLKELGEYKNAVAKGQHDQD